MSGADSLHIRVAEGGDLPALARLCTELGYASSSQQITQRFQRIGADREHRVFVAVDETEGLVGWVQVHLTKLLESDMRGEIIGLVVASASRRRGIGRKLVAAAESWTRSQGGTLVSVRCNQTRTEAHLFYGRLGYAVAKTQLNFRKQL